MYYKTATIASYDTINARIELRPTELRVRRDPAIATPPPAELREHLVKLFKHRRQHHLGESVVIAQINPFEVPLNLSMQAHLSSRRQVPTPTLRALLSATALLGACAPAPETPPEPQPALTPFIPSLTKQQEKLPPPKATLAPALYPSTDLGQLPRGKLTKRVVQLEGGLFRGGDPETIDQIDAAFVTRVDLLATADDGNVEGWFLDDRLLAARASIGGRPMIIGYFDKTPRPGFYDFDGMGMDGKFRARPVPGSRITSRYGLRFHPVDKTKKEHKGTDFGAPTGTPVLASAAGRITTLASDPSAGIHITLEHESGETLYLHMSETTPGLKKGDIVRQGQEIGKVGSTGKSTGPHLHYELRYIGVAVDSTKTIPRGQTALSPSEKAQHQERIRRTIDEARQ